MNKLLRRWILDEDLRGLISENAKPQCYLFNGTVIKDSSIVDHLIYETVITKASCEHVKAANVKFCSECGVPVKIFETSKHVRPFFSSKSASGYIRYGQHARIIPIDGGRTLLLTTGLYFVGPCSVTVPILTREQKQDFFDLCYSLRQDREMLATHYLDL